MQLRSLFLISALTLAIPLSLAEKDPNAKATVTNPSASFLDVSARRAELAHATTPRVLEALSWKSGCVNVRPARAALWRHVHSAPLPQRKQRPHQSRRRTSPPPPTANSMKQSATAPAATSSPATPAKPSVSPTCSPNGLPPMPFSITAIRRAARPGIRSSGRSVPSRSHGPSSRPTPPFPPHSAPQSSAWMHKVTEYMFDQDPHPGDDGA